MVFCKLLRASIFLRIAASSSANSSASRTMRSIVGAQSALFVGNDDRLALAGSLVDGRDGQDTVGVNLESDLDLGLPPGGRRNVGQVKLAELVVVLGHRSFTLEYLDRG